MNEVLKTEEYSEVMGKVEFSTMIVLQRLQLPFFGAFQTTNRILRDSPQNTRKLFSLAADD